MVVEHRDRLARFGVEPPGAALSVLGGRIVVADPGKTTDGLARDIVGVLTSMCPWLHRRRGVWNPAMRALAAAIRNRGGAA
jgi:putative resolvase